MDERVVEKVARAICEACDENPMHKGDCRGNEFRWQDYREPAMAAITALTTVTNQKPNPQVVAGYTADDLESNKRAFTVYRAYDDAAQEAKATQGALTTLYRES